MERDVESNFLLKLPKSSIFENTLTPDLQNMLQSAAGGFEMKTIVVALFFSIVGYCAWRHGRHAQSGRHMILAVLLMVYPYFVWNFWWSLIAGSALTVFLFWP